MFTGIIEELGYVREIERRGEDARIVIEARAVTEGSRDGDSIAVNGVCLTGQEVKPDSFAADVSKETLFRSTLGSLKTGSPVNLERAVTPATRLGGHIVQGHVDARGAFLASENHGDSWTFRFAYPKGIARYLVLKGSVAVEGISLTIANLTDDYFEIAVIPKTLELTNFSYLKPGDAVNLEADVLAKHLERFVSAPRPSVVPTPKEDSGPPFARGLFWLVIIVALTTLDWFVFRFFQTNYFIWYLQKAPFISLAASFFGPVMSDTKTRFGLVSTHPAVYGGACLQILGMFFLALGAIRGPEEPPKTVENLALQSPLVRIWDTFIYIILSLLLAVLTVGWVLTVAPIGYFVTLIAGVPGRQMMRGVLKPARISENGGQVIIGGTSDISFIKDPFVITQVMTSLLLFLVQIVLARFA